MTKRKRAVIRQVNEQLSTRLPAGKRHLSVRRDAYRPPAAPAPGAIDPEDGVVPTLGPGEPARGPDPREELLAPIEEVDGTSGDVLPSEFVPYPVPENGAPEDRPGPAPPPTPGGLAPGT